MRRPSENCKLYSTRRVVLRRVFLRRVLLRRVLPGWILLRRVFCATARCAVCVACILILIAGTVVSGSAATPRSALDATQAQEPVLESTRAEPCEASDTTGTGTIWELRVDGSPAQWPLDARSATTDVQDVAGKVVQRFRQDGFYDARLDSVHVQQQPRSCITLFVSRGPQVVLGEVEVNGADSLGIEQVREILRVETGKPLDRSSLENGIDDVLSEYEAQGYPLASVQIDSFRIDRSLPSPALTLVLDVDEGPALWLKRVALPEGVRTLPRFVTRVAGLKMGEPLRDYDPSRIRTALEQTGLFANVGELQLRTSEDGGATLFIPLKDVSPGTFDVVLGYLPPSGGGSGQLVGNGSLALRNVLGGGRRVNLRLDRRPQQVSLVEVRAVDPYVAGWPVRADIGFSGEQRDSTFSERTYRGALGIRPSPEWSLSGTISREVVRPGQGGTQVIRGEQQVPRASSFFYGVTAQLERVDDRRNPRRGVVADVTVEQGRKRRSFRRIVDADTLAERETLRQERIQGSVRTFLPTFERQVVVLGGDASLLRSDAYDTSDLFRIGGAQSLRGYDEDRFLGRIVSRALLEYRLQIDRVSFAYVFFDLGYVDTPETGNLEERKRVLPGYGFGLQFGTPLGIANLSYALGPDDSPARGRIHLGVSFGL